MADLDRQQPARPTSLELFRLSGHLLLVRRLNNPSSSSKKDTGNDPNYRETGCIISRGLISSSLDRLRGMVSVSVSRGRYSIRRSCDYKTLILRCCVLWLWGRARRGSRVRIIRLLASSLGVRTRVSRRLGSMGLGRLDDMMHC
jgi:hypothetical protein